MSIKTGNVYLIDTTDTNGKAHTAENLEEIVISSIKKCQSNMQFSIRSVVTDNAANINKMWNLLNENYGFYLITFGFYLLVKDIAMVYLGVPERLKEIIKYFCNNQFANSCYRSHAESVKLVLSFNTKLIFF